MCFAQAMYAALGAQWLASIPPSGATFPLTWTTTQMLNFATKATIFVRDWATSRWTEGRPVALQDELPKLNAMIRAAREAEALQQQEEYEY